jgi:outer membrane lipoprotein carrier protein
VALRWAASALLIAVASLGTASAATPAEDLARRIEAHHQKTRDLVARFTQTYRSGLLGRESVERGRLSLKRPHQMRWEYEAPEKKTFVSDGRRAFFYVPADRQVIVKHQGDERSLPSQLLAGGEILATFEVSLEPEKSAGLSRLRLVPRHDDAEVAEAFLVVDAEARIRSVEINDAQGSHSRFDFAEVRENVGLKDDVFEFTMPKGVEVIEG